MKKTYQKPNTTEVFVTTQKMIAVSGDALLNGFETNTTTPLGSDITSGNLSRRGHSLWDDEEEDF